MGFIPDEWWVDLETRAIASQLILIPNFRFTYFYPKTGVTGPYVFLGGLTTYLFSKEIYVMEHEFYSGLSILMMVVYATKKFGPQVAAYLDKEVDVSRQCLVNAAKF